MDEAITTWSATRQAAAIRAGEISSRELLEQQLARVDTHNPVINAVVTLDVARGRAAADAADVDAARGAWRGPLHGLPVTIKDAIEVAGMRSTGGAVELTDHIPERNAPVVERLEAAGAVVFAKTNVPAWSADIQTYNELFGPTNNPWATDRTTGGSSGGPAAAVACGFSSFEIGTDIGGSIRMPAHLCGIFGLKPSFGVVSQRGYLDHVGGGVIDADINVFGPLARTAEDLDLLLDVLAGPPPEAALAWRLELPPPRHEDLAGYRVGVWLDEPGVPIDPAVRAVLGRGVDALADAGAQVAEAHPPVAFAEQRDLFYRLIAGATSTGSPAEVGDPFGGSHRAWLLATEERAALAAVWADWFGSYDILVCPVLPTAAFPHDHAGSLFDRSLAVDGHDVPHIELIGWVGLIGVLGLPVAVPPLGLTADGLPCGMQIVAPFLRDRDAVRVAGLLAAAMPGAGYSPPPGY